MFLSEARKITPINFWENKYAGNTDDGTRDLRSLLDEKVFDNPKPIKLIERILEHSTDSDSIILDFFAGSGTTGHAVALRTTAGGSGCRYILVQLPEPVHSDNKDQKAAADFLEKFGKPLNLAELTKERLRRAAKQIKNENPMFTGDLGFRAFKLDTSNIRAWEPDRDDLDGALLENIEHIKPGRSEEDILYEVLLKLGLDLCVPIETRNIAGKSVRSIGAGTLVVCLDERITREDVEALALGIVEWHDELAPAGDSTVVFRDSAFTDDVAKANLTAILLQHGENVRSL